MKEGRKGKGRETPMFITSFTEARKERGGKGKGEGKWRKGEGKKGPSKKK